jgi:4-amino-4-deoxy-L-arabinose transferase-like glycosyltransferase
VSRTVRALFVLTLAALAVRLAIWPWFAGVEPHIYDEEDYVDIATSLAERGEFAMHDAITSARPPFYPAVVAVVYRIAGVGAHQVVRLLQIFLNAAIVPLLFALGRRLYDERTGLWAAGLAAFYPSLWGHDYLLLTEVLFTLLLVAGTLSLVADAMRPRWTLVATGGVLFGLGALTRTSLLFYPPLFAIATFAWRKVPSSRRIVAVLGFTAAFALAVAPWIARNTRLHGRLSSIDSYSNWTAAKLSPLRHLFEEPGSTWATRPPRERGGRWDPSDVRAAGQGRDGRRQWRSESLAPNDPAPRLAPEPKTLPAAPAKKSEGEEPLAFRVHVLRALNGLLWDALLFWRIDREIAGAAARGWMGPIPQPVVLALTAAIAAYYVVLALAAAVGLFLRPPADRFQLALLLSVVVVLFAVHTFSVGHSRYHIPVMPLLSIFAARLWVARGQPIQGRRLTAALSAAALLIAGWVLAFARYDLPDVRQHLDRPDAPPADAARID